jgi:hypothetical protein
MLTNYSLATAAVQSPTCSRSLATVYKPQYQHEAAWTRKGNGEDKNQNSESCSAREVTPEWLFCKLPHSKARQQEDKKRQQELQLLSCFSIHSDEIWLLQYLFSLQSFLRAPFEVRASNHMNVTITQPHPI